MTKKKVFLKSGNTVRVRDDDSVKATPVLPVGTYTVKYDERMGEFFLEEIEDFTLPAKIYGKNNNYAERILRTFEQRPNSTGVLLSGIKGAGKTLLAKQTSVLAREHGVPTIVINKDWHGDEFNSFIQSINTPTILLFDEFEKIYGWDTQRKVLTLFDGVYPSRKLFLVTTNNDRDINEYMRNRPGRIYYDFAFDTLGQDFIEEFLDDRLKDKSHKEDILKYTKVFSFFNFDMLNAAVEEMNRYGESLPEVLEVLNIKPENRATDTYQVDLVILDRVFTLETTYNGFQPNSFEYRIWTDELPDAIVADEEVSNLLRGVGNIKARGGKIPKPRSVSSDECAPVELETLLSNADDTIFFNPTMIKEFVQNDNKFVYSVERNGTEVQLHVSRNETAASWKYDPRAL